LYLNYNILTGFIKYLNLFEVMYFYLWNCWQIFAGKLIMRKIRLLFAFYTIQDLCLYGKFF